MAVKISELQELDIATGNEETVILDEDLLFKIKLRDIKFTNNEIDDITLMYDKTISYINEELTINVTNYDSFLNYNIHVELGTAYINDNNDIIYVSPSFITNDVLTINNKSIAISVRDMTIEKPVILYPDNNSINVALNTSFSSSYYAATIGSTSYHETSDWQIATDNNFTNIIDESINSVNLSSYSSEILESNTIYYIRVRYKASNGNYSEWSNSITITTLIVTDIITEKAILTASDKAISDYFGWSVSISGDGTRVIIGAYRASPSGLSYAGKAYIYSRSGTIWTEEVILTASDKVANDYFGRSVSISGDGSRVVIGAQLADPSGLTDAGKVYIFIRSGTIWTEEAILTASDKAAGDYFGYAVSIANDGTRVIVGAYRASPSGLPYAGKAYIYIRSGTVWTEEAILTASDKYVRDNFGYSVYISGDGTRVIIGAYQADPSGLLSAGKAYIFSRSGTVWTEEAILTASDKATYDNFGISVSISGDGTRVIIGAYRASPSGLLSAGKAYIYSRSGTVWTEEVILTASDKVANDYFGRSVSISGDGTSAIIGAYASSPFGVPLAGKAYIFSRSGTTWTEEAILTASDKAAEDNFGISVSISGDGSIVIIGAYAANPSGVSYAGKAYIF